MSSIISVQMRQDVSVPDTVVRYRTIDVDGFRIFYRDAGAEDLPALLLLRGFPTASHMFRGSHPTTCRSTRRRTILIHADGQPPMYWQGASRQ
jgi:hypothetical protein